MAACRIDDIAIAAGVSRGSFYFHHPTKEHVLIEYMRETEPRFCSAVKLLPERRRSRRSQIQSVPLFTDLAAGSAPSAGHRCGGNALRRHRAHRCRVRTVREMMAERFASAARRNELSTLLPPGDPERPLPRQTRWPDLWFGKGIRRRAKTVLQSTNILFFGGVQVGNHAAPTAARRTRETLKTAPQRKATCAQ